MDFQKLNLKRDYRSFRDNLVEDFYIPILSNATLYRRAVGFFSSSSLLEISSGLTGLFCNGGNVQLIASPKLSEDDINAINLGYEIREKVIEKCLISQLEEPQDYFESEKLNLLAHLIANNKLDIKIAVLNQNNQIGIYHEKLGIVYDELGNKVVFTGSLNETGNALIANFESIDVFTSWQDIERVNDKEKVFLNMWENNEIGLQVLEFPEIKNYILKKYKKNNVDLSMKKKYIFNDRSDVNEPIIPKNIKLRKYQMEAIQNWQKNNYVGIFDMATGSGKTITAIYGMLNLYKYLSGNIAVIIVCPFTHLVEQWVEDLKMFNINPIIAHSQSKDKNYKRKINDAVVDYNYGIIKNFFVITTNDSYRTNYMQKMFHKLKKNTLLLVDEAHNFGAKNLSKLLWENFDFRLALSATLDRHNDSEGTDILYKYFGNVCIHYSLEQAIREKMLTPYYYYPVPVYLSQAELEEYKDISKQLSKQIIRSVNGKISLTQEGKWLAIRRSKLVASAVNKGKKLKAIMGKYKNEHYMIVYCGAANLWVDDTYDNASDSIRQIDYIIDILGNEMGIKVAKFTATEDNNKRKILIDKFQEGKDLQALVAIKCLDEGVNIPKVKIAFLLASTTNPKEYIQRRGRVLRLAPGKEFSIIYDFITLPRNLDEVTHFTKDEIKYDKSMVKNELKRIKEFRKISLNPCDSDLLLGNIQDAYGINIYNMEKDNEGEV